MTATIGLDLETERLRHRSRQIERVVTALRDRVIYRHSVTGMIPTPLERAIADFEIELRAIRHRLTEIS